VQVFAIYSVVHILQAMTKPALAIVAGMLLLEESKDIVPFRQAQSDWKETTSSKWLKRNNKLKVTEKK